MVQTNIQEDQQLTQAINRLLKATGDLRPAFKEIGESGLGFIQGYFDKQQTPWGEQWPEVSPEHLAYKKRKGFLLDTLKMRGVLFKSINYRVSKTDVTIGSPMVYANRQNEERDFIDLGQDPKAVDEFRQIIIDRIADAWTS